MVSLQPLSSHLPSTPPHKAPGPLSLTLLTCNPQSLLMAGLCGGDGAGSLPPRPQDQGQTKDPCKFPNRCQR